MYSRWSKFRNSIVGLQIVFSIILFLLSIYIFISNVRTGLSTTLKDILKNGMMFLLLSIDIILLFLSFHYSNLTFIIALTFMFTGILCIQDEVTTLTFFTICFVILSIISALLECIELNFSKGENYEVNLKQ